MVVSSPKKTNILIWIMLNGSLNSAEILQKYCPHSVFYHHCAPYFSRKENISTTSSLSLFIREAAGFCYLMLSPFVGFSLVQMCFNFFVAFAYLIWVNVVKDILF